MSDFDNGNYVSPGDAGLDAALDSAFERSGAVIEDISGQAPTPLSAEGMLDRLAEEKAGKGSKAKADKDQQDGKADDERTDGRTRAQKRADQLDKDIDEGLAKSAEHAKKSQADRDARASGSKPQPMRTKDFIEPEVVKARRELRSRFGGVKLSERLEQFEKWEAEFRRDPVATREAIMSAYLRFTPQIFGRPKNEDEGAPRHTGEALDRAFSHSEDMSDLKTFIDKHGANTPKLLRQINDIERDLIDDPVGASARLAAAYGAPVTEKEQAAYEQQKVQREHQERRVGEIGQAIDLIHEHGILPHIKEDAVLFGIADVLESNLIQRTGDNFADLQAAYHYVMAHVQETKPAGKTSKGQKSISGAPSRTQSAKAKSGLSLDASIDRAFEGV